MGAPWHLHRDRFAAARVVVRSSNYTLYGDMSRRVMEVLSRFTPDLEICSIDEAFLGLRGFGARLESHARALCAVVLQCFQDEHRRARPPSGPKQMVNGVGPWTNGLCDHGCVRET